MSDTFVNEINQQLAQLTPGQQQDVLSFVRSLSATSSAAPNEGTPGKELLKFVGTIPNEDLEAMKAAIEEGCGQVDPDGW